MHCVSTTLNVIPDEAYSNIMFNFAILIHVYLFGLLFMSHVSVLRLWRGMKFKV